MSSLSKSIFSTIAYYDVMDYPMTAFEIWKNLLGCNMKHETHDKEENVTVLLGDIMAALENEEIEKYIEEYRGFYFLKGKKHLVQERIKRNKISEEKYKKLKRAVWFLRFVPFVRMVGVTGRMAMKNAEEKSDLDLLIVLEKGKIFTGRTLVTIFTHLLGMRRHGKKIKNRVCLNYFITTDSLEINLKDLFSASEYSFILPMFGWKEFQKFQLKNSWIKSYKENFTLDEVDNLKLLQDSSVSEIVRKIGEYVFSADFIEKNLKKWETKKILKNPNTQKKGSIIISDSDSLVFLPDPQGPKVYGKFRKKMEEIGA